LSSHHQSLSGTLRNLVGLKKPLKVEQLNQTVKILVHNGPSWSAEQQSSKLLVGL
jgi:hypothetical protein